MRRRLGAWTAGALAAVAALVFVLSRFAAVEAVYPVEHARQTLVTRVWSWLSGMFRGASAAAENIRLRREISLLSLARTDLERCEAENDRLRQALGYRARQKGDWLAAAVLARGGAAVGTGRTLRVDRGSLAGVRVGAVVTVPEGLVGRVSSVTPHTAIVTLVTDVSSKVSCEIERTDALRPHAIASGDGGETLSLSLLTVADALPPRSRVVTSGFGGVYPAGILVGFTESSSVLLPSVCFDQLEDVFIRRDEN